MDIYFNWFAAINSTNFFPLNNFSKSLKRASLCSCLALMWSISLCSSSFFFIDSLSVTSLIFNSSTSFNSFSVLFFSWRTLVHSSSVKLFPFNFLINNSIFALTLIKLLWYSSINIFNFSFSSLDKIPSLTSNIVLNPSSSKAKFTFFSSFSFLSFNEFTLSLVTATSWFILLKAFSSFSFSSLKFK